MGEAAATGTSPGSAAPAGSGDQVRSVYQASGGRKLAFSFIFLLLLPFFVSLAPMLVMRMRSGLWHDLPGFLLFAAAFAVLMLLIVSELMRSLRMRISLGQTALHMTVPAAAGPTPLLGYKRYDIPWSEIAGVETRREIYGGWLAPVMMQGARVLTKDGRQIKIGYGNEANVDPAFPYAEIARQIAARAGVTVTDKGNVRRTASGKLLGRRSTGGASEEIGKDEIEALNGAHRRFMIALLAGLLLLVGAGIVVELTASQPVAREARGAPPVKK